MSVARSLLRTVASFSTLKNNRQLTRNISTLINKKSDDEVKVTFIISNGKRVEVKGKVGDSLLNITKNTEIDLDYFDNCMGNFLCTNCHVILKKEDYDRLPNKPSDDEFDMLSIAYELTDTSRLGCQVFMTKDLNGLEVILPQSTYSPKDD